MKCSFRLFLYSVISLTMSFVLTSCVEVTYLNNGYGIRYETSVNSWGQYNLYGKTYYIESGDKNTSSSDLEFREYTKYLVENLKLQGAIITTDKKNADLCILMNYSIADESYTESIPIPIWGATGISSINTVSNTRGSAYGSAYSYGGYTSGSVYGSSTTNARTNVNYNYGITGVQNVNRYVKNFARVVNIYAYDNMDTSAEHRMLWKTNLASSGSSNDLRKVMPYIMYISWGELGHNSDGWQEYQVFEDDYMFQCWKQGVLSNPNITTFPRCDQTNVNDKIRIAFVEKLSEETVICLRKTGCESWYSISPYTYIQYGGQRFRVSYADNYELGTKIRKECGTRYIRLHFPVNLRNVSSFDYVEYTNKKETDYGFMWRGVKVK